MSKKAEKMPTGVKKLPSGKYIARVSIDGVQQTVPGGPFSSKTDARDARSLALARLNRGEWIDPSGPKTRFDEWSDRWLDLNRGGNTKTLSFLRSRVRPQWGSQRLGDITPAQVQLWMNAMVDEGLAPHTIHGVYGLFKRIMQSAVDHDLLPKSPCRLVTGKPAAKTLKEQIRLSPKQLSWLEVNAPARYAALIHLGAWTGMRIGELIGLRWDDLDLETGILHVQRSGRNTTTKNGKSRLVRLSPATVDVMRAHRRDFGNGEWVFTTEHAGCQLRYEEFRTKVWKPLVAGLVWKPALPGLGLEKEPTLHDLRHSHATLMIAGGIDAKVLSDRLGHHAPSFTLDVYGLPRADADDVVLAAIDAAMVNNKETS